MAEIFELSIVDASNTGRWPEGMLGGQINNAGRADEGILARWYNDTNGAVAASGSSNAFAITSFRTISVLFDNLTMVFTANHTITGAATLNLNGLGAKAIKRFNGSDLTAGDIVSELPVSVIYKSAPDAWFMVSAAAALVTNMFGDFSENAAPGNPAANVARLYAKDDAAVTILAYRDSGGTEREVLQSAIINRAYAEYTASADLTAQIPFDDTIPQQTEGTEILAASITLSKATNRVRAMFSGFGGVTTNDVACTAALFLGSGADALAAQAFQAPLDGAIFPSLKFDLVFEHAPGSVGPHTYKVRVGPGLATTMRMNGTSGGRAFGGVARSTLILEEIHV